MCCLLVGNVFICFVVLCWCVCRSGLLVCFSWVCFIWNVCSLIWLWFVWVFLVVVVLCWCCENVVICIDFLDIVFVVWVMLNMRRNIWWSWLVFYWFCILVYVLVSFCWIGCVWVMWVLWWFCVWFFCRWLVWWWSVGLVVCWWWWWNGYWFVWVEFFFGLDMKWESGVVYLCWCCLN